MGFDKLSTPFSGNKKAVCTDISNIRHITVTAPKAALVKISSDEIKAKRISAYRYLLP